MDAPSPTDPPMVQPPRAPRWFRWGLAATVVLAVVQGWPRAVVPVRRYLGDVEVLISPGSGASKNVDPQVRDASMDLWVRNNGDAGAWVAVSCEDRGPVLTDADPTGRPPLMLFETRVTLGGRIFRYFGDRDDTQGACYALWSMAAYAEVAFTGLELLTTDGEISVCVSSSEADLAWEAEDGPRPPLPFEPRMVGGILINEALRYPEVGGPDAWSDALVSAQVGRVRAFRLVQPTCARVWVGGG